MNITNAKYNNNNNDNNSHNICMYIIYHFCAYPTSGEGGPGETYRSSLRYVFCNVM